MLSQDFDLLPEHEFESGTAGTARGQVDRHGFELVGGVNESFNIRQCPNKRLSTECCFFIHGQVPQH